MYEREKLLICISILFSMDKVMTLCIELYLHVRIHIWGVAVLKLNNHPDHNKTHGPRAGPKTYPIDHSHTS